MEKKEAKLKEKNGDSQDVINEKIREKIDEKLDEMKKQLEQHKKEIENIIPFPKLMQNDFLRKWYPIWIHNAMENYAIVKRDYEKEICCLSAHPRPMNRPAIIIGAGPSLNKTGPLLKDWKHPIFVSASQAPTIVHYEREPDYISAFDSLWVTYEHLLHHNWKNSILLAHPTVEPKTLKSWKWKKFYYRRMYPGHEFYEFIYPLMYPMIRIGLKFTGSVVNNMILIASFLGYDPLFLVGVDYGWKKKAMTRANTWKFNKKGEPVMDNVVREDVLNNSGIIDMEGYRTAENHFSFKVGLLETFMNINSTIIDCSDGIINEFPKVDFKQAVEKQGKLDIEINKDKIKNNIKIFFTKKLPEYKKIFDEIREKEKDRIKKLAEEKKEKEKKGAENTNEQDSNNRS